MNIDSVGVSVPGGGRVDAGSWIVVNAIFREQTGKTVCPDAFADRIQVAVWTRDAPVRENGGIAGPCNAAQPLEQAEGAPQYRCLPDGTLSRQCTALTPCPGSSACVEGLCRQSVSIE